MDVNQTLIALGVSAALAAGAGPSAAALSAQEDDSVHKWGRWAVLAPAAGAEEVLAFPVAANEIGRCEAGANCPDPDLQPIPEPDPEPVVKSPCEAGMPCGFARIDRPYDPAGSAAPGSSSVVPFQLLLQEENGTVAFVVNPDSTTGRIQSNTVPAIYTAYSVRSRPGYGSDLRGELTRDGERPVVAQGPWRHVTPGNPETEAPDVVNGGEYVWGITASKEDLERLASDLGADTIAVYQGATLGVLNGGEGNVRLEVNFDGGTWTGDFGGTVAFTAAGVLVGSGFVSSANGFSNNITSGEVKGGFVNTGHTAVGGYDVTTTGGHNAVDVFRADLQTEMPR